MSFSLDTLSKTPASVGQSSKDVGVYAYKTDDSSATVEGSNYFLAARHLLTIGDRIYVTRVTNLNAANEAYVSNTKYVVTAVSRTLVSVTAITSNSNRPTTRVFYAVTPEEKDGVPGKEAILNQANGLFLVTNDFAYTVYPGSPIGIIPVYFSQGGTPTAYVIECNDSETIGTSPVVPADDFTGGGATIPGYELHPVAPYKTRQEWLGTFDFDPDKFHVWVIGGSTSNRTPNSLHFSRNASSKTTYTIRCDDTSYPSSIQYGRVKVGAVDVTVTAPIVDPQLGDPIYLGLIYRPNGANFTLQAFNLVNSTWSLGTESSSTTKPATFAVGDFGFNTGGHKGAFWLEFTSEPSDIQAAITAMAAQWAAEPHYRRLPSAWA